MKMYAKHREALMRRLPDGLILLSAASEIRRNNDVSYVFRQGSDFLYLTGVEEPDFHVLIDPKRRSSTLFMPKIDNRTRVWRGDIPGPAEASRLYGISRVRYSDALESALKKQRRGYRKSYSGRASWKRFGKLLPGKKNGAGVLRDSLQELRAVKSPDELSLLRRANKIGGRAHRKVMRAARPGMYEYELQALFEAECRSSGLRHLAYPSIIAGGINSATLHYERNNALLKSGELLLIDAGGEARGYAADITRTYPVGRRFTRRQRDVYSIVLETQKECIRLSRPGITSAELHAHSMRRIAEGLRDLKILRGSLDDLVTNGAVRLFYPHGLGHMLGLDVHDGNGGKRRKAPNPAKVPIRYVTRLEPGFVITVEPGIYFIRGLLKDPALRRKHRRHVDFSRADSFLDFGGIRIEDDILIRARGGPVNLTRVPKEIAAIEKIRGERG